MTNKRYIQAALTKQQHADAKIAAFKEGKSLSDFVKEAVLEKISNLNPEEERPHVQEAG